MTKITYHLKNGKSFATSDGKGRLEETAADVSRSMSDPDHTIVAGTRQKAALFRSSSVDYVELGE